MAELPGADAPVVNAPAADAVPALDAPAVDTQAAEEPVQAPKTFSEEEVRKTVNDRLTKERKRLRREVESEVRAQNAERELERLRSERTPQQPEGEPQQKDFDTYEDWLLARAEWRVEQKLAKQRETTERETAQQRDKRELADRAQYVRENIVEKGRQKYEDFDEVVMGDVPISPAMVAAASRMKAGSDVLYRLCKDSAEAERIAALPDVEQVWALKEYESKLAAPPKSTSMPAPIKPNSASASVDKGYRPDMTDKEFDAMRERQRRERNAR